MDIDDDNLVRDFKEKPRNDNHWINGGFFVLDKRVKDYLPGDMTEVMCEQEPIYNLTANQQLVTFKHHGFWKPMDSLKDKNDLNALWDSNKAPWKKW